MAGSPDFDGRGTLAVFLKHVDQGEVSSETRTEEEAEREVFAEFAREVVEKLKQGEGVVYGLEGHKIKDRGRYKQPEITTSWHNKDAPEIEDTLPRYSKLTVIPSQLHIPGSNRKTLEEQRSMVDQLNGVIESLAPGLRATIPSAPDMVELIDAHFSATGEALFSGIFEDQDTARLHPVRFRTDTVLEVGENAPREGRFPTGVALLVKRIGVDREIELHRQALTAEPIDLFAPLVFESTQAQALPQAA